MGAVFSRPKTPDPHRSSAPRTRTPEHLFAEHMYPEHMFARKKFLTIETQNLLTIETAG